MDSLDAMDKFLETHNLLRRSHEETENSNRPITSKNIEPLIKNLPTRKRPGQDSFIDEFYQTFFLKKDTNPPHTLSKIEDEEILPNSFYDIIMTLILKPDKDYKYK